MDAPHQRIFLAEEIGGVGAGRFALFPGLPDRHHVAAGAKGAGLARAPCTTTARTAGSPAAQARSAGSKLRYIASDMVLSACGRLSVTMPSPPRRSSNTSSLMVGADGGR